MSSKEVLPLQQWANLLKLLEDILQQKPVAKESTLSRVRTFRTIFLNSPYIGYLVDKDYAKFKGDMAQGLYPDRIRAEYQEALDNYAEKKMKPYEKCIDLSKEIIKSESLSAPLENDTDKL